MKDEDFFNDIKPLTKFAHSSESEKMEKPSFTKKEIAYVEKQTEYVERPRPQKRKYSNSVNRPPQKQSASHGIWFFAIIAFLVLIVAGSFKFSQATISITPKIDTIPINETLSLGTTSSPVTYETVSIDSSITSVGGLPAKVEKKEKARGSVTFYNSFSATPQKLIKNTRIINTAGNIYTLDEAVVVPGFQLVDKKTVPGSITANVTASEVGETYNSAPDTFKVFLLKGTPKYDTLYAKSTTAFTGGLDGSYYASATDDGTIIQNKEELTKKLNNLVQKQIPDNYLYIPGLSVVTFNTGGSKFTTEPDAQNTFSGTIQQVVFEKDSFKKFLISKSKSLENAASLDLSSLKGTIVSREADPNGGKDSYSVSITGDVKKESIISTDAIKDKLAGVSKSAFTEIMAGMSDTVAGAELSIKPFWIFSIPKSFNRINIVNTNGR